MEEGRVRVFAVSRGQVIVPWAMVVIEVKMRSVLILYVFWS